MDKKTLEDKINNSDKFRYQLIEDYKCALLKCMGKAVHEENYNMFLKLNEQYWRAELCQDRIYQRIMKQEKK